MKKTLTLLALTTGMAIAWQALAADDKEFRPLFNGKDLSGWKLRNANGNKSWTVLPGGILKNTVESGQHGVDLVTEKKFWNFTVRYEYMTPEGSNSGFYLRGRYEIQILGDAKDGKVSNSCNGSLYSFRAPDQFVTKPGGEWQTVEATIIGDRITVTLNGVKVHDNVQITRATGGELDHQFSEPGPIFLQGDHGTVSFRNIMIKELQKD
jgi:hypothetical protein